MKETLDQSISQQIEAALEDCNLASLKKIIEDNQIDPSSFLYAKARKNAYPLLQRAVNGKYTNKNAEAKIEIIQYLAGLGADLNVSAPYGLSVFGSILHAHYWLRITSAKYEVYMLTLLLALDLLRKCDIDVNLRLKGERYDLDEVVSIYDFHAENQQETLAKIAFTIIEEMLQKGAKIKDEEVHTESLAIKNLFKKYKNNENLYQTPVLKEPDFHLFLTEEMAAKALQAWANSDGLQGQLLQAVKFLEDGIFLHAQWRSITSVQDNRYQHLYWQMRAPEQAAIDLLHQFATTLEPKNSKAFLAGLKKISTPMKPCYDYNVFQQLYTSIVTLN